jgi:hypothetical protein
MVAQKNTATPVKESLLKVGDLVHLVSGGRTLTNYEVLGMDDRFVKLSANPQVAPQTSVVLVPWTALEILGLPNE